MSVFWQPGLQIREFKAGTSNWALGGDRLTLKHSWSFREMLSMNWELIAAVNSEEVVKSCVLHSLGILNATVGLLQWLIVRQYSKFCDIAHLSLRRSLPLNSWCARYSSPIGETLKETWAKEVGRGGVHYRAPADSITLFSRAIQNRPFVMTLFW